MVPRGFTLVEVMVALVILAVAILGMATLTSGLVRTTAVGDLTAAAIQLAEDRIEEVRIEPVYARIDSLYAGVETGFPTLPGFTRTTEIVRYGGPGQRYDYKKITVKVQGPGLPAPVVRSVTVAAP
jgi:prepilin-type N-terminal cleavage/methylation domain-containing protein